MFRVDSLPYQPAESPAESVRESEREMASGGVLATKPPAGGTYSYSSQPRAVEQRKKYRDSGPQAQEG